MPLNPQSSDEFCRVFTIRKATPNHECFVVFGKREESLRQVSNSINIDLGVLKPCASVEVDFADGCGLILIHETCITLQLCAAYVGYAILIDLAPELIPSRISQDQSS